MKKVLSIAAMALAVVLVFTSCNKEKTRTQMLTIEKGWIVSLASCPDGYGENATTDLMTIFPENWKDNVMKFKEDGNKEYINAGANKYDFEGEGDQFVGTWEFKNDENILVCQLPMFYAADGAPESEIYSAEKEECNIVSMEEEKMVLSHKFNVPAGAAKWQVGTWTFQFTFVPNK
ncbi:MAG: hypothetical protein J6Y35_00515 [Bacteroidales bacterium]|nr:hypothetical protein [Bacteroidales bacterium]